MSFSHNVYQYIYYDKLKYKPFTALSSQQNGAPLGGKEEQTTNKQKWPKIRQESSLQSACRKETLLKIIKLRNSTHASVRVQDWDSAFFNL